MGQSFCSLWLKSVTINGKRYRVMKEIGEGAFSFVQLVRRDGELFALKRIRVQVSEQDEMVTREVKAHRLVMSPNIMPLVDYEVVLKGNDKEARLLFPYYSDGSLQELIEQNQLSNSFIQELDILLLFRSLCEAVKAFHTKSPPLAHRDIKPHNCLLSGDQALVLMDLGSVAEARVHINSRSEAVAFSEKCAQECTAAFRAPEMFEVPSDCLITESTDIWALGCTLYAMAFGKSPFEGTAMSAVSGSYKIPLNNPYSKDLMNIVGSMLQVDPLERPTIDQVISMLDGIG